MKQDSFFKPAPTLLIAILGALMPLTAIHAQASRDRDMNEQVSPTERLETTPPSGQSEETTTPSATPSDSRGAQGPIRSDTTAAPSSDDEREKSLRQENEDQQRMEQKRPATPMGGSGSGSGSNNY